MQRFLSREKENRKTCLLKLNKLLSQFSFMKTMVASDGHLSIELWHVVTNFKKWVYSELIMTKNSCIVYKENKDSNLVNNSYTTSSHVSWTSKPITLSSSRICFKYKYSFFGGKLKAILLWVAWDLEFSSTVELQLHPIILQEIFILFASEKKIH